MKKILIMVTIALIGASTLSAQNDSSRKQKKQKRSKADSTQQHWQGDGKNWPADTIHHMINGKDSLNKY
jgi:uncharacterized protein YdeI (BOF family)